LLENGAALILCSHLGRPKGEAKPEFSLKPVAAYLDNLIDADVQFADDCLGASAKDAAAALQPGQVLVLENTRYYAGEKKNDPEMAKTLASYADLFVNDAFGTAHRAHASTVGVASYLPAVAGFLLEKEIEYLGNAVAEPTRPFVAILGGAKVSDKIEVIKNLLTKADKVLIGGGMANTFFKAQGYAMGSSLVEEDALDTAKELLATGGDKLCLPVDMVIADKFAADANTKTLPIGDVEDGWSILDVGPETVKEFSAMVASAGTVVWNGPMGVFEMAPFAKGTFGLAEAVANSSATTIVGGGDSVAAVKQSGLADKITHISTGGGASLEMLEGKILPGLAALNDK
jgi:phosphoglycerate kinase